MISIFEKLGIYGLEQDKEDAILASVLTGDPILLIGKQGTAKTGLIEVLGSAFHESSKRKYNDLIKNLKPGEPRPEPELFNYHIYDASKINFEDLVGFPNPGAMQKGKMEYIKSPMTAWDKKLIGFDEFNRQEPARQNNIFELVRSRRLMGMDTGTKWIMNAMNPFGMAGTEELDEALVDRHQWFVYVSAFVDMNEHDQERIVKHIGSSDAVGLREWSGERNKYEVNDKVNPDGTFKINDMLADAGDAISSLMQNSYTKLAELNQSSGNEYVWFVSKFFKSLTSEMNGKPWKVELSGRRAGLVHRALLAFRAVDLAKCDIDHTRSCRNLKDMFKTVLKMTIPIGIANAAQSADHNAINSIMTNVDFYSSFFKAGQSGKKAKCSLDSVYELLTTTDLAKKVELLLSEEADEVAKNTIWSKILNGLAKDPNISNPEELRSAITLGIVAHVMTVKPDAVPKTMQAEIARHSSKILKLNDLCDQITLKGQLALRHKEIGEVIDSYPTIFARLQAKSLFEIACTENMHKDIDKETFNTIVENVKNKCNALNRLLQEQKIDGINVESKKPDQITELANSII